VQAAFYQANRDVTQASVLAAVAEEAGFDPAPVVAALASPEAAVQLQAENRDVAGLGVEGYPTVLALTRPRPTLVTHGFRPKEVLAEALAAVDGEG
jgi:putative protein-disulfide isomerase